MSGYRPASAYAQQVVSNRRGGRPPPGGASSFVFGNDAHIFDDGATPPRPSTAPSVDGYSDHSPLSPTQRSAGARRSHGGLPTSPQAMMPPSVRSGPPSSYHSSHHGSHVERTTPPRGQTVGTVGEPRRRGAEGGAPNQATESALLQLRHKLNGRGTTGIAMLASKFRSMDDTNDGQVSYTEFHKAMIELNVGEQQTALLFRFFDEDCSGYISYDEFVSGIAPPMNAHRKSFVAEAFKRMDKDGNGKIELVDFMQTYDVSRHPDFMAGTKTKAQILRDFMDYFDDQKDGVINWTEWVKYYAYISASIDRDDYFELMMRNAWHISGGTGAAENTSCLRVLATHRDGTQTVEEVKDDLGLKRDDYVEILKRVRAMGVDAIRIDVTGNV